MEMSREKGVIVLDARSKQKFDELHIAGAVNLSFPDISIETLAERFPDKNAKILIYCNNNFKNAERAFQPKSAIASLNISTYFALYGYGYKNVYELGPYLDAKTTKLKLVSSAEDGPPVSVLLPTQDVTPPRR
ncbi:MAG: rhodanese-like domain-containing protein [Pirellulales bacterium]